MQSNILAEQNRRRIKKYREWHSIQNIKFGNNLESLFLYITTVTAKILHKINKKRTDLTKSTDNLYHFCKGLYMPKLFLPKSKSSFKSFVGMRVLACVCVWCGVDSVFEYDCFYFIY